MRVTKCDRCKRIFEDSVFVRIAVIKGIYNTRNYDLCEECKKELEEFLKMNDVEE